MKNIMVWELKTSNGRTFRITTENKNQVMRLKQFFEKGKENQVDIFISCAVVMNGITDISYLKMMDTYLK